MYEVARTNALTAQMQGFLNQIRVLHVGLILAKSNEELAPEFITIARRQLLQIVVLLDPEESV